MTLPWRVVTVSLLLCASPALAQDDSAWKESRRLVARIGATTPSLPDSARLRYRAGYAALRARRDSVTGQEARLIGAFSALRDSLRALADSTSAHAGDLARWQDRRSAHDTLCGRRFDNQADVSRCDRVGERLASERTALDARQEWIASRHATLDERQQALAAQAGALAQRSSALSTQVALEVRDPLRRVLAQRARVATLRLTGKSFIKRLDLSSMKAAGRRQQEFARVANVNFSENPATPSPRVRDYRLWSQVNVVLACREDTLVWWRTSQLAHRAGTEARVLDAETSVLSPVSVTPSPDAGPTTSLAVTWAIKGKPNDATLSSFQAVRPRTCSNIWHRVTGTFTCHGGTPRLEGAIAGSAFPSHRVWMDLVSGRTVEQGRYEQLWECDPSSPDLVR